VYEVDRNSSSHEQDETDREGMSSRERGKLSDTHAMFPCEIMPQPFPNPVYLCIEHFPNHITSDVSGYE
jgi:hypothetical protein